MQVIYLEEDPTKQERERRKSWEREGKKANIKMHIKAAAVNDKAQFHQDLRKHKNYRLELST